jgi:hypothetical protein
VSARPGDHVHIEAYSRPSTTYAVIRGVTVVPPSGVLAYTFRPSTNTRLFAASAECGVSGSVAAAVHGALSIVAHRDGLRRYTFSGAVSPAASYEGKVVGLYYLNGSTPVLKGVGRVRGGKAAISVSFQQAGRWTFYLSAAANPTNAVARSKNRPTVIG